MMNTIKLLKSKIKNKKYIRYQTSLLICRHIIRIYIYIYTLILIKLDRHTGYNCKVKPFCQIR